MIICDTQILQTHAPPFFSAFSVLTLHTLFHISQKITASFPSAAPKPPRNSCRHVHAPWGPPPRLKKKHGIQLAPGHQQRIGHRLLDGLFGPDLGWSGRRRHGGRESEGRGLAPSLGEALHLRAQVKPAWCNCSSIQDCMT